MVALKSGLVLRRGSLFLARVDGSVPSPATCPAFQGRGTQTVRRPFRELGVGLRKEVWFGVGLGSLVSPPVGPVECPLASVPRVRGPVRPLVRSATRPLGRVLPRRCLVKPPEALPVGLTGVVREVHGPEVVVVPLVRRPLQGVPVAGVRAPVSRVPIRHACPLRRPLVGAGRGGCVGKVSRVEGPVKGDTEECPPDLEE